ncbi:MAG: hypothetical protein ACRDPF_05100, partial [Streptosporangiaceae bacterium]
MLADVKDLVRLLRRIAVTVAGTVILAVGAVLLVAPGPGLVLRRGAQLGLGRPHLGCSRIRRVAACYQAAARSDTSEPIARTVS